MITSRSSFINFDHFHDTDTIKQRAMNSAVEGGPNSGFEIEGMDFFKNPETANEFPEMRDDIDLIVSTEAYVRRLVDFRNRVLAANGMSRGMAYELMELGASNEAYGNPNQFTQAVSAIGWEPSLEAINYKLWGIIAAAVAFVVGIIYKFVNWIFGSETNGGGSPEAKLMQASKGVGETKTRFKAQTPIIDEIVKSAGKVRDSKQSIDVPKIQDLESVKNSRMPPSIKDDIISKATSISNSGSVNAVDQDQTVKIEFSLQEALFGFNEGPDVYEYIRTPSKYARFIYTKNSDTLDLILASFDGFVEISKIIASQIDLVKEVISQLDAPDSPVSTMKANAGLTALKTMTIDKSMLRFGKYTFYTPSEWRVTLANALEDHATGKELFTDLEDLLVNYQQGHARLEHVNFDTLQTFFKLLADGMAPLMKLSAIAQQRDMQQRLTANPESKNQANLIISVSNELVKNLTSAMGVFSIISKVYHEVSVVGYELINAIRKNSAHLIAFYNRYDEIIPPTLEEFHEDLLRSLGQFKGNITEAHMVQSTLVHHSISHVTVSGGGPDADDGPADPSRSIVISQDSAREIMRTMTSPDKKE